MKKLLVKLAWKIINRWDPPKKTLEQKLPFIPDKILERAAKYVEGPWEENHGGEYKKHQVYARLIKDYPDERRRLLSLAVEVVLCSTE